MLVFDDKLYQFPDRLKGLMIETNLNQNQLSRETGITQATISRWLSNERRPTIECLIVLAIYFKCSIDYLVGLSDE